MRKIKIRVAVILIKQGKILLVKHRKENRIYWVLPGGEKEFRESLIECAKREVKEELNLLIDIRKLLYVVDVKLKNLDIIDFFFLGKIISGNLKLKKDKRVKDFHYFDILKLDNVNLLPKIADFLKEDYLKKFKDGGKYLGRF